MSDPFEESSVWDPKVVMERFIVPEDQMIQLKSIPGWTKVQDNQNSLRLDKDFSIESSQSECSVIVTENNQRIEKNTKLFNEQTENRKSILETYKVYRKKLTRSLSFFAINKSCENLFNSETLKRSLSLQSICQLSDTSAVTEHFKNVICENSAKRHLPSDHSELQKSEEIFLNKENNSKTIETVLQLPVVKISTPVENATLHSGSSKENNAILPVENAAAGLKQLICTADQPTKHFESVNVLLHSETAEETNGVLDVENATLHSESSKENNAILPIENAAAGLKQLICTADQPTKHFESVNVLLHSETAKETNGVLDVENAILHSESSKENNAILPVENAAAGLKQLICTADQPTKHFESVNVLLHSGISKENNAILPVENAAAGLKQLICTADQPMKHFESVNVLLHSETAKETNGVLDVENAISHSGISKENNAILPVENAAAGLKQLICTADQPTKHFESVNVLLHSETAKETNGVLDVENAISHSGISKENNAILPVENAVAGLKQLICTADQPTKHFESVNVLLHSETAEETDGVLDVENATLHSESSKENNAILPIENAAAGLKQLICTADQPAKHFESVNVLLHSETAKETNGVLDVDNADLLSETEMKNNSMLPTHKADSHSEATEDSNDVLADNADLHSVAIKVSNSVLPAKNVSSDSNNIPDQLTKHDTESTNANNADLHFGIAKEEKGMLQVDNVDLHFETAKENNGVISTVSTAPSSNSVYYETTKTVVNESVNADDYITSSVVEIAEFHVPVSSENYKSDKNYVKEGLDFEITTTEHEAIVSDGIRSFNEKETIPSNYSTTISNADVVKCYPEQDSKTSIAVECFVSGENIALKNIDATSIEKNNDENLHELGSSKSSALDIPAKESSLPKKKAETTPSVKNSGPDMENDKKECGDKTCDPSNSSCIYEISVSKKRKLELRNKKYKKHKSEEKQGNLKIRSIKRAGEVCYSAEEIKTMLDFTEKTCGGPSKSSGVDETPVSKKRKLEPRNKRSKKHKSEKKLGNLKIRSIKRAGETCYSAEEIKTMLDLTEWKPLL